jgi:hypothetical protein
LKQDNNDVTSTSITITLGNSQLATHVNANTLKDGSYTKEIAGVEGDYKVVFSYTSGKGQSKKTYKSQEIEIKNLLIDGCNVNFTQE